MSTGIYILLTIRDRKTNYKFFNGPNCNLFNSGEIDDQFNEFFIESRSGVPIDRMWHDKYRVR